MNRWIISLLLLITTSQVFAQSNTVIASPIVKDGFCPSGYSTSGDYCVPSSHDAKMAIAKHGFCPSGYSTSGNYCVANSHDTRIAIPKSGFCPSGFSTSGNYCVGN